MIAPDDPDAPGAPPDGAPPHGDRGIEIIAEQPTRGEDTTAKIDTLQAPPRPRPIITPERTDDGWKTAGLHLRHAGDGYYLAIDNRGRQSVIHLTPHHVEQLLGIAASPDPQGRLWSRLSEIPLERPLPSRQLEEELRVLLTAFAGEIRQRRR